MSGPVAGSHNAGIAIFRDPRQSWGAWFASDWGTVAINPLLDQALKIEPGEDAEYRMRLVVHDGLDADRIAQAYAHYTEEIG